METVVLVVALALIGLREAVISTENEPDKILDVGWGA